jgi:hypothetical protein
MDALPLQCAWCRRYYDAWGVWGEPPPALLPSASHGICIVCLSAILAARASHCLRAGDQERARVFERQRVAVLRAFLLDRPADRTAAQARRYHQTRLLLIRSGQSVRSEEGAPLARERRSGVP